MKFNRSFKGILVDRKKYALEIISELRIEFSKHAWTLMEVNTNLTTYDFEKLMQKVYDDMLEYKIKYQRLIGKMLYLTLTRSHLTYLYKHLSVLRTT